MNAQLQTQQDRLEAHKATLHGELALLRRAEEEYETASGKIAELNQQQEILSQVIDLFTVLESTARGLINNAIDPLAMQALTEIFGEGAIFQTEFTELPKAGYTARFVSGDADQVGNPLEIDGGSVAEILSDAVLRPLVVCLHTPKLERIIVLDEPFAGVDVKKSEALCRFLQTLAEKLDVQIILTSHTLGPEMNNYADNSILVGGEE